MKTFTRRISGREFAAASDEALDRQAEWLLRTIEGVVTERGAGFIATGRTVQVGWTILTLVEEGERVTIFQPDYLGNPFQELTRDLTQSLSVLLQQNTVASSLNVEPRFAIFHEKIVHTKGAFERKRVYLQRQEIKPGDSGWFIGEPEQGSGELEGVILYQLLKLRPAILKVLALPIGFIVVFNEDTIEAILDANDCALDLDGIPNFLRLGSVKA